jgi:hypothetical protein
MISFVLNFNATAQVNCRQVFGVQTVSNRPVTELIFEKLKQFDSDYGLTNKNHPRNHVQGNINAMGLVESKMQELLPVYKTTKLMLTNWDQNPQALQRSSLNRIYQYLIQSVENKKQQEARYFQNPLYLYSIRESLQNIYKLSLKIDEREFEKRELEKKKELESKSQDSQNPLKTMNSPQDSQSKDSQSSAQVQNKNSDPSSPLNKSNQEEKSLPQNRPPQSKLDEDSMEDYQIFNKDLQANSENENTKPVYGIVTSAPVALKVLGTTIFDVITPDGKLTKNADLRSKASNHGRLSQDLVQLSFPKNHYLTFKNEQGAKELSIPLPSGFEAVTGRYQIDGYEFEVVEVFYQEFKVKAIHPNVLPPEVSIWLQHIQSFSLSIVQREELTKPSGILESQWPDHIKIGLGKAQEEGQSNPFKIAESLSSWFQEKGPYLYNSRTQKMADHFDEVQKNLVLKKHLPFALAIAQEKMFNCDGAALLGVTLLRDHFKIPARIRAGRVVSGSKKDPHGHPINYVDLNDPKHAWVEVFVQGKWVPFDFTPKNNQPDPAPSGGETKKLDPANDPRFVPKPQDVNKDKKPIEDESSQDSADPMDSLQPKDAQDKNKSNGNSKAEIPQIKEAKKSDTNSDFYKLPSHFDSPLGLFAQRSLYNHLTEFKNKGPVNVIKSTFVKGAEFFPFKKYFDKAKLELHVALDPYFRENDKPIKDLLIESKNNIYRDPANSYQKLQLIQHYYKVLGKYQKLNSEEVQFLKSLDKTLKEMARFKHPESAQQSLIKSFLNNLPGQIIKKSVLEAYPDAEKLGSMDQKSLFKDLVAGRWQGAYQASLINKRFNFFLNAEKVFQERRLQTLLRSFQREKKSEGIVAARIQDIANFQSWILDPEYNEDLSMTMLSKLLKDEQYMMGHRQMISMPGRTAPMNRKHTNVFFDISGSMEGNKARIQASAIAALVDNALSEKDLFGKPLHTVILFPFGDKVKEGIVVESAEQAQLVISDFLTTPTSSKEGTKFQPCFDKHFEVIHKYASKEYVNSQKASKLNLKNANMVLITDGEAEIDLDKIQQDLKDLPDGVKTFFNLVTLGKSANQDLQQAVKMIQASKAHTMITEIDDSEMQSFIDESQTPQIEENAFAYDRAKGPFDMELINSVLALKLPVMEDQEVIQWASYLAQDIKSQEGIKVGSKQSPTLNEIGYVIELFQRENLDFKERQWMLAMILKNYSHWTGHSLSHLSSVEENILLKLVAESQGGYN